MGSFAIVCLSAAIISVAASIIWFKEKNIIESTVMGIVIFFCTYVVGSMGLFVIDSFSLFRAAGVTLILDAVILAAAVFLRRSGPFSIKKLFRCDMSLKDMLIPIIVCLLALPFVSVKNELFGMGQDQGVYQIQAIAFMNDDNARQKDFSEFHKLDTQEERDSFEYFVKNALRGYDIPNEQFPDTVYDRNVSEVSGIFHGIPTFAAMLAMWGTIFGMENMIDIETVFYLLMIFMVYFICRNLKLKNSSAVCACIAAASAPVVIWTAKASLTEMFLTLIPLIFAYFMTDDENPRTKWLSLAAVVVFGCYHVSIYTMIPMFFIIYGGMYFFTREKQYAVLMPAVSAVYLLSFLAMRQVQPVYTLNNYSPVFALGIDQSTVSGFVFALCAALIVVSAVFVFIVSRTNKKFDKSSFNRKAAECRWFRAVMILLIVAPCAYIVVKAFFKYETPGMANRLTIVGFIGNAGIILLPLAFIAAVVFVKHSIEKNSRLVMFLMFFYCILVYSSFLRYDIQYYYYYSRYIGPFIPVAVLFAVMALDRFGGKLMYPAVLAGLAFVAPYDSYLMSHKDDTRMEWSVLEDIADIASEGDCVLIDRKYMDHLWLPLRSITEANVYPQEDEFEEQFASMSRKYGRVLFVTDQEMDSEDFSPVYVNIINHSEDDTMNVGRLVPMSKKFWETTDNIYVYTYDKYQFSYTAAKDYRKFSGVSALEGEFCWTSEEAAVLDCGLYPDDYRMTVSFGCGIPFEQLGIEEFDVTVFINGEKAGTETVNSGNNGADIAFDIAGELILDGSNEVTLETGLWSAAEINPEDERMLGIPLKSVVFSLSEN